MSQCGAEDAIDTFLLGPRDSVRKGSTFSKVSVWSLHFEPNMGSDAASAVPATGFHVKRNNRPLRPASPTQRSHDAAPCTNVSFGGAAPRNRNNGESQQVIRADIPPSRASPLKPLESHRTTPDAPDHLRMITLKSHLVSALPHRSGTRHRL